MDVVYTYACLGKLPPIMGKQKFSFNVLARSTKGYDEMRIRSMIQAVNHSVSSRGVQMDFSGLRIDDDKSFEACYPGGGGL